MKNYKKHEGTQSHTDRVALHEGEQSAGGQGTDSPGGLEAPLLDPEKSHNWGFDGSGDELDSTANQALFDDMGGWNRSQDSDSNSRINLDDIKSIFNSPCESINSCSKRSSWSDLDDLVSQGFRNVGQDHGEAEQSQDEETDPAVIANLLTTNEQDHWYPFKRKEQLEGLLLMGTTRNLISRAE
ncbi:hypothetical protein CROQUDRAFT_90026 [Cronartium quercuum f. sp. fusiforme G11]|uniref:Uncharacterized protein n=1 Tax=Cronartium quercuum f. sp. fusiforme G11 TaxID=708437 RepID=A0A9P6NKL4_9BASI|nr:hypothetical protein CROQUDRAFT_90026 [Cronartium quercuum f. sp. fusiforme G11]